ncbi:heavy-metal-associated domain-containing protein [Priestia endophytica]|uniref:heavy-metal-associated domain-containing protein n=1 Tax=Priestia endophytica TaxID=135735 RepID=UPI00227F9F75|nr:heavy metal-associated domain-containing protein [Priestia endophytica]MCY8233047.1 heavy-metal-associated domain-containing protein [Priestia endophytica]
MENGFLKIEGMRDENDVNKVLHALNEVWGVSRVEVSLANRMVTFSYDEKAASQDDFLQAVKDTGLIFNEK